MIFYDIIMKRQINAAGEVLKLFCISLEKIVCNSVLCVSYKVYVLSARRKLLHTWKY